MSSAADGQASSASSGQQQKYHFNNLGLIREIIYPNKAIITFRLNGRDERAILLSKVLTVDGKSADDSKHTIDYYLKVNDKINFDCHLYDKGGVVGTGKDRCNYYAMRATKNSKEYEIANPSSSSSSLAASVSGGDPNSGLMMTTPIQRGDNVVVGTGWISELTPRKGVVTFEYQGKDERALFLASKVWLFEKRLGAKQPLSDILGEGDAVQFEAVPSDGDDKASSLFCTWFANVVWKGKRPPIEDTSTSVLRRGSSDTANESSDSHGSSTNLASGSSASAQIVNGFINKKLIKGIGVIAKILNEKSGVIWWIKSANHLQSVWFEARQSFMFGDNLAEKNLFDVFREGDPVTFLAEEPPNNFPTKWVAKQVLISDQTAKQVTDFLRSARDAVASSPSSPDEEHSNL